MIWRPTHLSLRVVFILLLMFWEWFPSLFIIILLVYPTCSDPALDSSDTSFCSCPQDFWRFCCSDAVTWRLDWWMSSGCRVFIVWWTVTLRLYKDGSSYRNRFYFSIFEISPSLRTRLLRFFPLLPKLLFPFFFLTLLLLFLIFKRFLKPSSFDSHSFPFVSRPKVFKVLGVPFLLFHRLC